MHRSKLCAILVDCNPDSFEAGINFWSRALAMEAKRPSDPIDPYVTMDGKAGDLIFMLQRVNDTGRIHLDIETDNIEAEVQRLESLGATRVAQIESWWVMRDPAEHVFCVVNIQTPDFADKAHTWNT